VPWPNISLDSTFVVGAAELVEEVAGRLRPIEVALAEAWWESNTHASPEADARREQLELERRSTLADADCFAAIRRARAQNGALDPLVRRQLDLLHDEFAPHQVPEDLRRRTVELEVAVESTFNTFRGEIDGQRVDDNAILEILRTSDDAGERRKAWEASKQVGAEVADRVRDLARLRNEAARGLGYRDHFALALATGELDEHRLFAMLDDVDRRTALPFAAWKAELDAALAERFACSLDELWPWHVDNPFFQDPPTAGAVDLDPLFTDADVEGLTLRTYDGLGLDLRPVLAQSDLYPRDDKSQHAFCIDIDREGDVRVLCNVEANERWVETMLHEFGHAVYDRETATALPWLLRGPAHALTTEGVAMLFARLPREPEWLRSVAAIDDADLVELEPRLASARRAALLVFARWVLVMTHFERALYAEPDADLDTLWWELVERYQGLRRPEGRHEPDWAAKVHLTVAPVYYQNYLYGELVASQLQATLHERAGGIVGRGDAGRFLVDEIFRPGASLRWDELVERATGRPLGAEAFAVQLTS
jgi:peptidyl-dipeptidase A